MKTAVKIVLILGVIIALMTASIKASGSSGGEYIVTKEGTEYVLSFCAGGTTTELLKSSEISDIAEYINSISAGGALVVFAGIESESDIILSGGNCAISGSLVMKSDAELIIENGNITFSSLNAQFSSGGIRIKDGMLTVIESEIISQNASALLMSHASGAAVEVKSGKIISESSHAGIRLERGTLILSGGNIESKYGYAIENSSTLKISGSPQIKGSEQDIKTNTPIYLRTTSEFYGEFSVKYLREFSQGELVCAFYAASESSVKNITLYDINNIEHEIKYFDEHAKFEEKNFAGVYLPYNVKFYIGTEIYLEKESLSGEKTAFVSAPEKSGYEFLGWTVGESESYYDFAKSIEDNLELHAKYKLIPPSFSLSSLSFIYDKNEHGLGISDINHPLLESGAINCIWYRNGERLSGSSTEIMLKNVNESGRYKCQLYFTVNNEIATVTTPEVDVIIEKAVIQIPYAAPKYYTGVFQEPELYSTALYTVERGGGTEVGIYSVKLLLTDSENYVFENNTNIAFCDFEILKADNYFTSELEIKNIYEGEAPLPSAAVRFGDVIYLYSESVGGVYTENYPTSAGEYFCKAYAGGTENYSEIESAPIGFSIIEEVITGISIGNMPNRTVYTAFEKFDTEGLIISVSYNSARMENIYSDKYAISYVNGSALLFGDNYIIASYQGFSVSVPINVRKADYDISNIKFADSEEVYDGNHKTVFISGTLPVGMDGIALEAVVNGGGINAGIYYLKLTFSTVSKNYNIPSEMNATLTVLPHECNVVFENTEFVYDGALKCPTAYYKDIYGRKILLNVIGEFSLAGEYTAMASCDDSNYKLLNPTSVYQIKKADYSFDNVVWSIGKFKYDGNEKSVSLSGVPQGVSVIGYSDNKAINAGIYNAIAVLSYDENNYNPPPEISFRWEIEKADYDITGFSFSDNYPVYNGSKQYPNFTGTMPMGIDGIMLEYSFSSFAENVNDGKVNVEIKFSTASRNYKTPISIYASVQVMPREISVVWSDLEFVYNATMQMPTATASESDIMVLGGVINAGTHTATAFSLDSNYRIINSTVEFLIKKAENAWISPLNVESVFEGEAVNPCAVAKAGAVVFYYMNGDEQKVDGIPKFPGRYYVIAESSGDENHLPITSEKAVFDIIKIIPVSINATLNKQSYIAFEKIGEADISATVTNNNGSTESISFSQLSVIYKTGDSLKASDSFATVVYAGFSVNVELSVEKANYDLSGVVWSQNEFVYDGTEKKTELLGLPDGITVTSYIGGIGINAGEYPVSAVISYDTHNYNKPIIDGKILKIHKQIVAIPQIRELVYNGMLQIPEFTENGIYTVTAEAGVNAGAYPIEFKVNDNANYEFSGGTDSLNLSYTILPEEIKIFIHEIDKYLFSKPEKPTYEIISGNIASGETLNLLYEYKDGKLTVTSEDPNYSVSFEGGGIKKHNRLSDEGVFYMFLILLIMITLLLVIFILIKKRSVICDCVAKLKCKSNISEIYKTQSIEKSENEKINPQIDTNIESINDTVDIDLAVDAVRADDLITDDLAKDLLRKEGVKVYTNGNKRGIINIDTLSQNFTSGDIVDVNKLKDMSLIPYDTAYIKVLARGMIDKPLRVYANDFSLSAVKMLALTGGEAIRVTTVKIKYNQEDK